MPAFLVLTETDASGAVTATITDNGLNDGTGTRTSYRPDGSVVGAEPVTGLYVKSAEEIQREEIVARLADMIAARANARAGIATGRTKLAAIVAIPDVTATNVTAGTNLLATTKAIQKAIRDLAAAVDGLAVIDLGVMDAVIDLGRHALDQYDTASANRP